MSYSFLKEAVTICFVLCNIAAFAVTTELVMTLVPKKAKKMMPIPSTPTYSERLPHVPYFTWTSPLTAFMSNVVQLSLITAVSCDRHHCFCAVYLS